MNKLTEEEILSYIRPRNSLTGVEAITRVYLESLDLDTIPELIREGEFLVTKTGSAYKFDSFTPRSGSIYFKPSFAGDQVLLGRIGRKLFFSNGRWFAGGIGTTEAIKKVLANG